ncbi:Rho1 guanine nucleotide exchange factor 3 [Venturia nashicola]|uniref:Rho1 guanine nucleotide exchange factor 3 n=1 Tax=Venturia nashicola TaxID=86259 RepID=A0A4Z1PCY9_9PEZI|nr:Rho1 guanine nucleotide exchange factor 3 [Venturia nashicola]TLD32181.1 Rho1 guanine nucleotide exchange factor 3 [Venturia nashicola]
MPKANELPSTPGISYFSPAHDISPGALNPAAKNRPTLFTPIRIRDVILKNRIIVAPMCQYSTAPDGPNIGALTDYHLATLGHYALKGAAMVMIEATGVQYNGRISPYCPGIWQDEQIESVRRVAEFIRSQGGIPAIQLAHAGRKASTTPNWIAAKNKLSSMRSTKDVGGWPDNVVGPMGGAEECWDGKGLSEAGGYWPPRALSVKEIREMTQDWAKAAKRSVKAGIEAIEIHAAHGYLISEFLSPITNRRTDSYGGSFENRIRILIEIVQAIRKVIPSGMPLFVRVSSTEWMEDTDVGKQYGSWDVESTIRLAKLLPALGVDLLDVSSGGNHPLQRINMFKSNDYQTKIAAQIRRELRAENKQMLIGAVGLITEAEQARDIVETSSAPASSIIKEKEELAEAKTAVAMTDANGEKEPMADVILVARQFMREPEWVLRVAAMLKVDVAWPSQFLRVRLGPKL